MPYFHSFPEGEDPARLLDPRQQVSTPWGGHDHGPCDKCDGERSVPYRCLSCVEIGADPRCPACEGRVEFVAVCPTCAGSGEISDTRRSGVSVFPTQAGLYRYMVERDAELDDRVIVELEGELSDELDIDADSGALLLRPSAVVTRHPVDAERVRDLRERLAR